MQDKRQEKYYNQEKQWNNWSYNLSKLLWKQKVRHRSMNSKQQSGIEV